MLRTKLLMLSVMTAFALSGCSNNNTAAEETNTVTTTTDTIADSTEVPVESEPVSVSEDEVTPEVTANLVCSGQLI